MSDHDVVGCAGRLIMPTRGAVGAGEVLIRYRGGTEALLAWSPTPLAAGAVVVVVSRRGPREYEVVPWDELGLAAPPPDVPPVPA